MLRKRRASRARTGRRCVAEGCPRAVRPGRVLCAAHARGAYGRELEAAVGRMARQVEQAFSAAQAGREDGAAQQAAVVASFERRVARGEYGELFEGRLREVMAQAAAERGIAEEIGALRVVLARLMTEPGIDPLHLAHGVARVAGTTVRALRVQREIEAATRGEYQAEFGQLVEEVREARERVWQRAQEEEREWQERKRQGEGRSWELTPGPSRTTEFPVEGD